jgi:hypothetical protein
MSDDLQYPALEAWHEAHPYGQSYDTPHTRLWFPHEAPYASLHTVNTGTFHGKPMVDLHLGSKIQVGGYLDEIEAYIDAARDALRIARAQADGIAARASEELDR